MSASRRSPAPDSIELPPLHMRGTGTLEGDYVEFTRTMREAVASMVAVFVADGDARAADADALVDGILSKNAAAIDALFRRSMTLPTDTH